MTAQPYDFIVHGTAGQAISGTQDMTFAIC